MSLTIGVLAVQGAFAEHIQALSKLDARGIEIRQLSDLNEQLSGIILPGGESTVMGKLLHDLGLFAPLQERIEAGLPVFGTCAGMILLAKHLSNDTVVHLGTMDITVQRNAYGRQLGSFNTDQLFAGIGVIPMTFIRAPYIEQVSENVQVLARVQGRIVAARQDNQLAVSFHPELTPDLQAHSFFLNSLCHKS